ncbi:MAG: hypothetical protein QM726_23795 [Chitinophagaceae bacterium]
MQHILYLKIENDIHSAKVTEIDHPHHQLYHVVFEDGYENMFFTDVETGNWIEEDLGETALAASFGNRINQVDGKSLLQPKALAWCRASLANMVINFGFCTYAENDCTIFEVYSDNHKFLCNLTKSKKGKWAVYGSDGPLRDEHQYNNQVQIIISVFEGMADSQ